jgi:hypothetical protein
LPLKEQIPPFLIKQPIVKTTMPLLPLLLTLSLGLCASSSASALHLNLSELHEFQLPTPATLDNKTLGTAISLSDTTAAIAAQTDNDQLSGSVYIYNMNENWRLIDELNSNSSTDNFGHHVLLKNDLLIVSANKDDALAKDGGAVYIYQQDKSVSPNQWKQVAKLTAPDIQKGDHFGHAIALSDHTLYIGAPQHQKGKVYIFTQDVSKQWKMTASIVSTDPQALRFGNAISIDQKTLVIGAPATDANDHPDTTKSKQVARFAISKGDTIDPGIESGAVFVYEKTGDNWQQTARLGASNRESGDSLGQHIAIQNNTIFASLSHKDVWDELRAGTVYTYKKVNNEWIENVALTAKPAQFGAFFGKKMSVLGDHILVGAHKTHVNGFNSGQAFLFSHETNNEWPLVHTQTNAGIKGHDQFGLNVALGNEHLLVASKHAVYAFQNTAMQPHAAIFYMDTLNLHLNEVSVPEIGIFSASLHLGQPFTDELILTLTANHLRTGIKSSTIRYTSSGKITIPRLALQQDNGDILFYSATLQRVSGVRAFQFKVIEINPIP